MYDVSKLIISRSNYTPLDVTWTLSHYTYTTNHSLQYLSHPGKLSPQIHNTYNTYDSFSNLHEWSQLYYHAHLLYWHMSKPFVKFGSMPHYILCIIQLYYLSYTFFYYVHFCRCCHQLQSCIQEVHHQCDIESPLHLQITPPSHIPPTCLLMSHPIHLH